jgi:hypothetical protein
MIKEFRIAVVIRELCWAVVIFLVWARPYSLCLGRSSTTGTCDAGG